MSKSPRILVVEDEKILAADMMQTVRFLGYNPFPPVATGEAAIEAVKNEKPDLLLMDIFLQGNMNGIEAARAIQEIAEIPIIYITAHSDDTTFNNAVQTAPFGYIIKPCEEKELKTIIEVSLFKFKMEQQLKESQERFKEIFQQNLDAIILIRCHDFTVIDANPMAENIFLYSRDELIHNFREIFKDEELFELFQQAISEFSQTRTDFFLDRCCLQRRDGSQIICSIKSYVIKLHQDEVFYCSFRDISDKIKIE